MEEIWPCRCPLCRLLIKPLKTIVRKRVSSKSNDELINIQTQIKVEEGVNSSDKGKFKELLNKYPIERVKIEQDQIIENKDVSVQEPRGLDIENVPENIIKQEPGIEETTSVSSTGSEEEQYRSSSTEIPKEIIERIDTLESEITKMKKYVKLSIDSIKATLVDLRTTMAELSNPFNILRKYADIFFGGEEKEERKGSKSNEKETTSQLLPQAVPLVIPTYLPIQSSMNIQAYEVPIHKNEFANDAEKTVTKDQRINAQLKDKLVQEEQTENTSKLDIDTFSKLIRWSNVMLNRISKEQFLKLIDSYAKIGVLENDIANALKKIVDIVSDLRSIGMDPEEQIGLLKELLNDLKQRDAGSYLSNNLVESDRDIDVNNKKHESSTKEKKDAINELLEMIGG